MWCAGAIGRCAGPPSLPRPSPIVASRARTRSSACGPPQRSRRRRAKSEEARETSRSLRARARGSSYG
eukprot:7074271-Alexandrium_andersonii.AAC.1